MPDALQPPKLPRLRWLNAGLVAALMPPLEQRLDLAERALVGLAAGAELPAKIGVHPRPDESFAHAMPAHLRGGPPDASDDLVGMKWITGVPGNRAAGLPALSALVVLNDPRTGVAVAILDGAPITAARTAAISGVAMRRWAPRVAGRPVRVAVIGAGAQGHSHVPVIGHVLPGALVAIHDRDAAYAKVLAGIARETAGIGAARPVASARRAVEDADVVVTCVSFGPIRQVMTTEWFAPDALVVAVDYATSVAAEVANDAGLFLVDERSQFESNRADGTFDSYPDPGALIGEAILAGTPRPPSGRVLVTHLGTGLADLVFADAIHRAALERHRGTILVR
jgi:alanine dehydrogenase